MVRDVDGVVEAFGVMEWLIFWISINTLSDFGVFLMSMIEDEGLPTFVFELCEVLDLEALRDLMSESESLLPS